VPADITIQGGLGRDPERRYTQDGNPVVRLSVGVSNRKRGGEDSGSTWYSVTLFGNDGKDSWQTERATKLRKGDPILLSGSMELREYEKNDGGKGYSLDVTYVTRLYKVDWMRDRAEDDEDQDEGRPPTGNGTRAPAAAGAPTRGRSSTVEDDPDLPFAMPRRLERADSVLLGGML
jgi:single-strand DNA-binding protein